jgi:hypothetical protein
MRDLRWTGSGFNVGQTTYMQHVQPLSFIFEHTHLAVVQNRLDWDRELEFPVFILEVLDIPADIIQNSPINYKYEHI